jgi:hypothetical protein
MENMRVEDFVNRYINEVKPETMKALKDLLRTFNRFGLPPTLGRCCKKNNARITECVKVLDWASNKKIRLW